jgi:hypothetical protein
MVHTLGCPIFKSQKIVNLKKSYNFETLKFKANKPKTQNPDHEKCHEHKAIRMI